MKRLLITIVFAMAIMNLSAQETLEIGNKIININGTAYQVVDGNLVPYEKTKPKTESEKADTTAMQGVMGRIIDGEKGVSFATVALLDAKGETVVIRVTDQRGTFFWPKVHCGTFTLEASCVGYMTGRFAVEVVKDKLDIGSFAITEGIVADELVVKADRILVRTEPDRIVYNVAEDPEAAKLSTKKIMEKVPWIHLDPTTNKLQVMGDDDFALLINGRRSLLASQSDQYLLEVLSAQEIKSVEVITAPDGKYAGYKAVINIVVENSLALNGFAAELSANASTTYSVGGGAEVTSKAGKLIYKANVGTAIANDLYGGDDWAKSIYYNNPTLHRGTSHTEKERSLKGPTFGRLSASYDFTPRDLLSVDASFSEYAIKSAAHTENRYFDSDDNPVKLYDTDISQHNNIYLGNANVLYEHIFADNPMKTLTGQYSLAFNRRNVDDDVAVDWLGLIPAVGSELTQNNTDEREQTFAAIFYNPFKSNSNYLISAKYVLRDYLSDCFATASDGTRTQTDRMDYRTGVASLAANYSIGGKRLKLTLGANIDYFTANAKFMNVAEPLRRREWSSDQSFNLSYKASDMSNFSLFAKYLTMRPGIFTLNPYVNATNPGYISKGNPDLKSQHELYSSLSYSLLLYKKLTLSARVIYSYSGDAISQYSYVDNDNVLVTTYANVGKKQQMGANVSLRYTFSGMNYLSLNYSATEYTTELMGNTYRAPSYTAGIQGNVELWKNASLNIWYTQITSMPAADASKIHSPWTGRVILTQNAGDWRLSLSAYNIKGRYQNSITEKRTDEYYYYNNSRSTGLSVHFSATYTFGRLNKYVRSARQRVLNTDVMTQ